MVGTMSATRWSVCMPLSDANTLRGWNLLNGITLAWRRLVLAEATALRHYTSGRTRDSASRARKYDWAGLRFHRGLAPRCEPELPEPHATIVLSPTETNP